ncbi:MAG: hypothetical protein FWG83_08155, partial [Oscillospiraceae bacterium]|nr:hypothetical protein [Oscillospiraceae bacterium]
MLFLRAFSFESNDEPPKNNVIFPNVGKVYASPHADYMKSAGLFYPNQTLYTEPNLRERESGESDESFALRCVAGLNLLFADMTRCEVMRAALITNDETIVTLMAGCGLPQRPPQGLMLKPGERWVVEMSVSFLEKGV